MTESYYYALERITEDEDISAERRIKIFEECVANGIDLNHNKELFNLMVQVRDHLSINFLINNGIDIHMNDDDAFISACFNGYYDIIELLLRMDANIHAQNDRCIHVLRNRFHANNSDNIIHIIQLLTSYGFDMFAKNNFLFYESLHFNNIVLAKFFIENGVDCATNNNKAIRKCIKRENIELCRFLLENGSDPNTNTNISYHDCKKQQVIDIQTNLLEFAILKMNVKLCELLFEFGARTNLNYDIFSLIKCHHLDRKDQIINLCAQYGLDVRMALDKMQI